MFSNHIYTHFSITFKWLCWKPQIEVDWGEPNHFVHPEDDFSGRGIPLNKQWSLGVMWGVFHFVICFNKELPYED